MIIRPSFTVLGGAAIGLVAGAAAYGAVASATTPTLKPAKAVVAAAPASVAHCAKGQKLEHGVCVIHIVRTVVVPATATARAPSTSAVSGPTSGASKSNGSSASHASRPVPSEDTTKTVEDATKVVEDVEGATDGQEGSKEDSALDARAGEPIDSTLAPY